MAKTQDFIDEFVSQGYGGGSGRRLLLNKPELWEGVCIGGLQTVVIVEPCIKGFEKYNDNGGEVRPGHEWLQSLV